jgi:hypothetical protein
MSQVIDFTSKQRRGDANQSFEVKQWFGKARNQFC